MKLEGLILDESDIIQESKTGRGGELLLLGKINLITTHPTDTIEVKISAELWNSGKAGQTLKQCVGQRMTFDIQYKEFSFGNDEGKHVALTGFHLFALPQLSK
ncbi:chemotaxis protein [Vibrio ostreicida]|uniref:Chemotaxis protein n=1 Tax=Vibrio ostreicida TaxID=526588 RepID=A0ABT8BX94_9VIBR|nr:chemotaxis protein [Vibrio ostreicida]MDN3611628.1 chemotaxis protein [Vibrio ostreicida]NPD09118.1 chemotaxis protein [Vibrio ostreicida]